MEQAFWISDKKLFSSLANFNYLKRDRKTVKPLEKNIIPKCILDDVAVFQSSHHV